MPALSRAHYRRELAAWFFLPVMLGAAEGGVTGVIAYNSFVGAVPDWVLSIAVALCTGAPAFANITSFLWASLSHGQNKIRFLVGLQFGAALCVGLIAFAPSTWIGLAMFTAGAAGARVCWAGVVTLRTTVWQANYPRNVRANIAGKLATVQTIMLALAGLAIGLAMEGDKQAYRWMYPLAGGAGLIGAVLYSKIRMRGHAALIRTEREQRGKRNSGANPLQMLRILRDDKLFRRYMGAMFIFGIGNLSMMAPLVIVVKNVFGYSYLKGILVTATVPILIIPLAIPIWSRMLDRMHIIPFRVIHSWSFTITNIVVLIAALTANHTLLWTSAVLRGISFGGGVLGWNLGHHDFTTTESASQYMGIHVTLTGVRGFIGPAVAVSLYWWFESLDPGAGSWVFAVCTSVNVVGALLFFALKRTMSKETLQPKGHVAVEVRQAENGGKADTDTRA